MNLPVVHNDTIATVLRDFNSDKKLYGRKKWTKIALENKDFFLAMSDMAETIAGEDRLRAEAFLRGAFLSYMMLEAQNEVDELKDNWG